MRGALRLGPGKCCRFIALKAAAVLHRFVSSIKTIMDFIIIHVVWDFRPWDVMTKVRYFFMVQIYNLRILEVEHDLETCQRPLST